jgi:hypothetical protein
MSSQEQVGAGVCQRERPWKMWPLNLLPPMWLLDMRGARGITRGRQADGNGREGTNLHPRLDARRVWLCGAMSGEVPATISRFSPVNLQNILNSLSPFFCFRFGNTSGDGNRGVCRGLAGQGRYKGRRRDVSARRQDQGQEQGKVKGFVFTQQIQLTPRSSSAQRGARVLCPAHAGPHSSSRGYFWCSRQL